MRTIRLAIGRALMSDRPRFRDGRHASVDCRPIARIFVNARHAQPDELT